MRDHTHGGHGVVDAGVSLRLVRVAVVEGRRVVESQPRTHLDRASCRDVVLVVVLVTLLVHTVLIEVTAVDIVGSLVAPPLYGHRVGVSQSHVAVEQVVPVGVAEVLVAAAAGVDSPLLERGIGVAARQLVVPLTRELEHVVDIGRIAAASVDIRFEERGGPVVTVGYHLGSRRALVERERTVIADLGRALVGVLGGNEHHAECTAYTVYGCRRSVFEHREALDILGVDRFERLLHAVDQNQSLAAHTDRGYVTADAHRRAAVGLAVRE